MVVIVIIGLGFAGVACYQNLVRTLPKPQSSHKLVLIDKRSFFEFTPSIISAFFNPARTKSLCFPHAYGFLQGEVVWLGERKLRVRRAPGKEEEIEFDYCVVACGSSYPFDIRPSKEETIDQRIAVIEKTHAKLIKCKNALIIGSGPTALEFAGYLKNKLKTPKVTISSRSSRILCGFPVKAANSVLSILSRKGVVFELNSEITPQSPGVSSLFDLIIPCTGNEATVSGLLQGADYNDDKRLGRITVNEFGQLEGRGEKPMNVFVCGDASGNGDEPDVVVKAEIGGQIVAQNIARSMHAQRLVPRPKAMGSYVIDLGSRSDCVFVMGSIVVSGTFAWIMKQFIEFASIRKIKGSWVFFWFFMFFHFLIEVLGKCERRRRR